MSEFTKSQLKCDLVNDRFVLEQEVIWEVGELGSGNFITIPAGFDTDFASIPWWLQWYIPRFGKHNLAALLHDYLYRNAKNKADKQSADNEFLIAMLATGVEPKRARNMYRAVKYFAKLPDKNKPAKR